jgi:CBS domain-containing protein
MRTIDAVRRSGIGIGPQRTIHDAAVVMERSGVGSLAVIDGTRLLGIVTDRDLVRRALAAGVPPDSRIDGVMTSPVVTIPFDAELRDAFPLFRTHGVRRLAVVQDDGQFAGMITIDDLLIDLAADLADLARPVSAEVIFGDHITSVSTTA